jgi:hypothetical protein
LERTPESGIPKYEPKGKTFMERPTERWKEKISILIRGTDQELHLWCLLLLLLLLYFFSTDHVARI